ncbi:MAG: hypothetical protein ACOZCL_09330 [Bacillota bacterium]
MSYIDEKIVLDYYIEQVEKDNIKFLQGKGVFKQQIIMEIKALKQAETMHDKIEVSKKLWKLLFESAMSYIDPDKEGYDELFAYFDEYVNFEELIFASDSFYRDHTIHCLWVYFLGEYVYRRDEFSVLFKNMNGFTQYYIEMLNAIESSGLQKVLEKTHKACQNIISREQYNDSIRCISALTHDLGYPIKKIHKINKCISKILPYYSISDYDEFNFTFSEIQKNFIDVFLDNLSTDFMYQYFVQCYSNLSYSVEEAIIAKKMMDERIAIGAGISEYIKYIKGNMNNTSEKERAVLERALTPHISIEHNTKSYMRYSKDFEEFAHGIMSAFLLVKNVNAFSSSNINRSNQPLVAANMVEFKDFSIKAEILTAITDHTSSGFKMTHIRTLSELLILIDELEEFSRISRANQNRQYINEFCKSSISCVDGVLQVDFIFDNENIEELDPELTFKGKCKRFLSLFDIRDLDESLKIKFRCIGKLPYDKKTYVLELHRKYANITIDGTEQDIPKYLKSRQFYSKEEYMAL